MPVGEEERLPTQAAGARERCVPYVCLVCDVGPVARVSVIRVCVPSRCTCACTVHVRMPGWRGSATTAPQEYRAFLFERLAENGPPPEGLADGATAAPAAEVDPAELELMGC